MKVIVMIPARMMSARLPGKPLLDLKGRPLVRRVYDQAKLTSAERVMVTSPDKKICEYCRNNSMGWFPSPIEIYSGTLRCAHVLSQMRDNAAVDVVVNWQVDEPAVPPHYVDQLIDAAEDNGIATLIAPYPAGEEADENIVKVAVDDRGFCRWFSRRMLEGAFAHVGIYAFSRSVLEAIGEMKQTPLSRIASLEQLVWLENDLRIASVPMEQMTPAVNVRADLDLLNEVL